MTKAEMREQIERAMKEFNGPIQRSERVLGKGLLSKYDVNVNKAKRSTRYQR